MKEKYNENKEKNEKKKNWRIGNRPKNGKI